MAGRSSECLDPDRGQGWEGSRKRVRIEIKIKIKIEEELRLPIRS